MENTIFSYIYQNPVDMLLPLFKVLIGIKRTLYVTYRYILHYLVPKDHNLWVHCFVVGAILPGIASFSRVTCKYFVFERRLPRKSCTDLHLLFL